MDEKKSLRDVLYMSVGTGNHVDLCIICLGEDVNAVREHLVEKLRAGTHRFEDEIYHDALFIDGINLRRQDQADHCLDCLLGLCEVHGIKTITIAGEGEPVEFFVSELMHA